ncbi:hypothetical protein C8R45DRAFT_1224377 [Mycena sanguinolenta]|nr:hypothetical protein C8R45DRAFT_1224377 [Mycena sanguinolenta]
MDGTKQTSGNSRILRARPCACSIDGGGRMDSWRLHCPSTRLLAAVPPLDLSADAPPLRLGHPLPSLTSANWAPTPLDRSVLLRGAAPVYQFPCHRPLRTILSTVRAAYTGDASILFSLYPRLPYDCMLPARSTRARRYVCVFRVHSQFLETMRCAVCMVKRKKGRPDGTKGGRSTKQERKSAGMVPYPRTVHARRSPRYADPDGNVAVRLRAECARGVRLQHVRCASPTFAFAAVPVSPVSYRHTRAAGRVPTRSTATLRASPSPSTSPAIDLHCLDRNLDLRTSVLMLIRLSPSLLSFDSPPSRVPLLHASCVFGARRENIDPGPGVELCASPPLSCQQTFGAYAALARACEGSSPSSSQIEVERRPRFRYHTHTHEQLELLRYAHDQRLACIRICRRLVQGPRWLSRDLTSAPCHRSFSAPSTLDSRAKGEDASLISVFLDTREEADDDGTRARLSMAMVISFAR